MNRFCLLLITLFSLTGVVSSQQNSAAAPKLQTQHQKASYAIGLNVGESMKADGLDLDLQLFFQGLSDALAGKEPRLTQAEIKQTMIKFQQEMQTKRAEMSQNVSKKNKKEGIAFLAANAKKPGVITLPSGLQYQVLKSGSGASPNKTDTVKAHYHGTFIDGTVFDSSVQRNEPYTTKVVDVISGWTEALLRMKVGDKWRLVIPSNLAYGKNGRSGISPNVVLIFEMELLSIEK